MPNVQVDGTLNVLGEVFIPSGTTFDKVVEVTGNQNIDGIKTFSSSPIVPTPTTGKQAVNKEYVDSGVGAAFVANDQRVKTALNATGNAPIYACRAWVNFNSYGTVAIRDSRNVSSIDDEDAGKYKINFTIPMLNSNYVLAGSSSSYANNNTLKTMQVTYDGGLNPMAPEYVRVSTIYNVLTREDGPYNSVAIF